MDQENSIDWFGIRTVYHFGKKNDGTNVYEERVCIFSGENDDEAFEKARREADGYAKDLNLIWHFQQEAYIQDGNPLIDGYEVFSELFEFDGDLKTFYEERYTRYTYTPDP